MEEKRRKEVEERERIEECSVNRKKIEKERKESGKVENEEERTKKRRGREGKK